MKTNLLKNITLPIEKCEILLDMPQAEAGEVIQTVLSYALEGKKPAFKDRYKEMFYVGLFNAVDAQKASAEMRADKCRKVALDNASKMKEAKKVLARQKRHTVEEPNMPDDLTFSYFTLLYGKKDTGNFNTEELWNELSDDDKRAAIAYAKTNYAGNPDISHRPWPSQFLRAKEWQKG